MRHGFRLLLVLDSGKKTRTCESISRLSIFYKSEVQEELHNVVKVIGPMLSTCSDLIYCFKNQFTCWPTTAQLSVAVCYDHKSSQDPSRSFLKFKFLRNFFATFQVSVYKNQQPRFPNDSKSKKLSTNLFFETLKLLELCN